MVYFQFDRKSWWQPHSLPTERLEMFFALSWFFILTTASAFDCYSSIIFKFFHYLIPIRAILRCWLRLRFSSYRIHHCCFTIYLYLRHHRTSNIESFLLVALSLLFFSPFANTHSQKKGWTNYSPIILYFASRLKSSEFRSAFSSQMKLDSSFFACELHAARCCRKIVCDGFACVDCVMCVYKSGRSQG